MLKVGIVVHVIRCLDRIRHLGLVARFSMVGLTVGVLVAGTMAWFIETRLTDLLLTTIAARASDQVERLGLTGYITADDFAPPHTPERLASIAARLDPVYADLHDEQSGVIRLQMFAPDGTILFTSSREDRPNSVSCSGDLYAMSEDGASVRQLTSGAALDTDPTWSREGTVVLFASDRGNEDGSTDLWVMRPDGTGVSRLWGRPGEEQEPVWHP